MKNFLFFRKYKSSKFEKFSLPLVFQEKTDFSSEDILSFANLVNDADKNFLFLGAPNKFLNEPSDLALASDFDQQNLNNQGNKILVEYPLISEEVGTPYFSLSYYNFSRNDSCFICDGPEEDNKKTNRNLHFDFGNFSANDMKIYLDYNKKKARYEYFSKRAIDDDKIPKDFYAFLIQEDEQNFTVKAQLFSFFHEEKNEYAIPDFLSSKIIEFVFNLKTGEVELPESKLGRQRNQSSLNLIKDICNDFLSYPKVFFDTIYEKVCKMARNFTGMNLNFDHIENAVDFLSSNFSNYYKINNQNSENQVSLFSKIYRITKFPFEPNLTWPSKCSIFKDFEYSRTDSEIFNKFCKKFKIPNCATIRKAFNKDALSIITCEILLLSGFKNIDAISKVIDTTGSSKFFAEKLFSDDDDFDRQTPPSIYVFFCKKILKKRSEIALKGQIAAANTISKSIKKLNEYFVSFVTDTLGMFYRFYRYIPREIMNEILHDGLDEHIHDALSNVAYKHQNRKVKFKYSKEQLDLEDEINGYKFLLPTNSYELCEIGNALHNCVASYVDYVEEKVCTIVIAYKDDETKKNAPKICIEVRNYSEGDFKGQVWQQRTDRNSDPNGEDSEVMKIWRKKHNLFFDEKRY